MIGQIKEKVEWKVEREDAEEEEEEEKEKQSRSTWPGENTNSKGSYRWRRW
jgi:hypothetical protein